ncbi:MAG: hypothetical protein AB7F59_00125 [Bdellovibrionales bacterium]
MRNLTHLFLFVLIASCATSPTKIVGNKSMQRSIAGLSDYSVFNLVTSGTLQDLKSVFLLDIWEAKQANHSFTINNNFSTENYLDIAIRKLQSVNPRFGVEVQEAIQSYRNYLEKNRAVFAIEYTDLPKGDSIPPMLDLRKGRITSKDLKDNLVVFGTEDINIRMTILDQAALFSHLAFNQVIFRDSINKKRISDYDIRRLNALLYSESSLESLKIAVEQILSKR